MIVKKGLCFNSANSDPAEIHLFSVFPHCGKRTLKAGMKKDIQEGIKKLSVTTSLGNAAPDRGAVFCLEKISESAL